MSFLLLLPFLAFLSGIAFSIRGLRAINGRLARRHGQLAGIDLDGGPRSRFAWSGRHREMGDPRLTRLVVSFRAAVFWTIGAWILCLVSIFMAMAHP